MLTCVWSFRPHGISTCHLTPDLNTVSLRVAPGALLDSPQGPDCDPSPHQRIQLLIERARPRWMAALGFAIASKEVFESVATLFQCPQEAQGTQPLCDGPVHLAVLVTGAELLREWRFTEDCQEGLGFLVAPVHTCCRE